MPDEDDRWLPPSPENRPAGPSDEGLPGSSSQPAPPAPEQPGSQWGSAAPPPTGSAPGNAKAILALIFGIISLVSIFCCPILVFAIVAIVLGHVALSQYKNAGITGGSDRGMALAGLICGYVGLIGNVIALILVIALGSIDWGEFNLDDRDGDDTPDFIDDHPDNPKLDLIAPLVAVAGRLATSLL